ncbi:hypothetical protein [Methanosarcina horonobensis]|uniref:hypothetical protein n=1 Tax=Methanosarcina horonobensis TaxID=418008 RepID=UPI000A3E92C8|nr:hypothetical protein [Methanosarcina horonobensis]
MNYSSQSPDVRIANNTVTLTDEDIVYISNPETDQGSLMPCSNRKPGLLPFLVPLIFLCLGWVSTG